MILRSYNDRKKLEALAKLSGRDEGLADDALHLETMRSLLPRLERAHEAGDRVTEEEVLAGLEGRRRVREEEHKDTLALLNNTEAVIYNTKDFEGALDYHQQALRVQEKVLGKTHPDTLTTIKNTAHVCQKGMKDFTKAEEMHSSD